MAHRDQVHVTSLKSAPLAYFTPDFFYSALRKNPKSYLEIVIQLMLKSPKWYTRECTGAFYINYH